MALAFPKKLTRNVKMQSVISATMARSCSVSLSGAVRGLCTPSRGPQTIAIHAGEGINTSHKGSAPDICMSTTFAVDRVLSFNAAEQDPEDRPYVYTRWGNPTIQQLQDKLSALENAAGGCLAYASGMAASTAVLLSKLSAGDHVVCGDINYPGTAELLRSTLPRFGITVSCVDTSCTQAVSGALQQNTKMIWVETPANPILRLADIAAIAEICHSHEAELVVDSTFATPMATKPLELGADYVVHSLTKYIGGHGDALGGAVLGRDASSMAELMNEATIHYGATISPMNAWLISRGAATLPIRMRAHEQAAMMLADFLESHPNVARVNYPGLKSHPQHKLAKRQMNNFGGMISFQVKEDAPAVAARMMHQLEIIHYAVSLGHHRSLIFLIETDNIINSSFGQKDQVAQARMEEGYRKFAGDGLFRFSVGLEDPEDLIQDLRRVLDT